MVMSAEILGECPFSFLYIPHFLIRHEASTYEPRTVQPEGEPAGSPSSAVTPLGHPQREFSPGRSCVPPIPTACRLAASSPRTWTIVGAIWVVSTGPGMVGDLLLAPRINHTDVRHH